MNVAAYGLGWIPLEILKSFLKTKWTILDYSGKKLDFEEVLKKDPSVIIDFNPPSKLLRKSNIEWILTPGAGINNLDLAEIQNRDQKIVNCHANSITVAEHAWALLMATSRKLNKYDHIIRLENRWPDRLRQIQDFNYDLNGKTLGLIGYGAIGKRIGSYAAAFGMDVIIFRKNPEEDEYHFSKLEELSDELDMMIVACPLTEETQGLVSAEVIDTLPSHAIIVNIARGPIIDEEALFRALRSGIIRGAGLDVWSNNQVTRKGGISIDTVTDLDNLLISPHRAFVSKESYGLIAKQIAKNLDLIASNQVPTDLVDFDKGY